MWKGENLSMFHVHLCWSTDSAAAPVHRVKITEDGRQALLKLSKGDMRRALNVLQACHAAYDETGEREVYHCTGTPDPTDIANIVNSMFSDEFTTSYKSR
jgi:replication factor C subunit 3/5